MHQYSYQIMKYFVEKYLDKNQKLEILDVGSYDVSGTYKSLFQTPNWSYYGLDMIKGPNVDIVSRSEYDFGLEEQFNVVISGNCLEHVEAPWKWIKEVYNVTKKGGIICIITPFSLGEHRYPVDCWRILPDGYMYLLEKESSFKVLETKINIPPKLYYFFDTRQKLRWLLRYIPNKILKILEYKALQDTYVIAVKH
jgi:SAM-dependent methyltransferase